jgi:ornithine cyclodeaminase/alanine dehydrogenase-like protein (mu-crystallin family)
MTLILSNDDVDSVLRMDRCIDALEESYREIAAGRAVTRQRSDSLVSAGDGAVYGFKTMDGVIPSQGYAAVRLNSDIIRWPTVAGTQRRVKQPLAPGGRYTGLVLLFSTRTGEPLAIMPDGVMQRMRVGATNGLGVKYMAREDARTVAILGSGWQAGSQLMAVCAVRRIREIRCYSPNPDNRERFAAEMSDFLGVAILPQDSAEVAIAGSDIVLCSSNSIEPIFFRDYMSPGMHVSSIKMPEIDHEALRLADRVGLHMGHQTPITVMAADLEVPDHAKGRGWGARHGYDFDSCPKLPDMVSGAVRGRERADEITCFINDLGLGLQFAVIGGLAYEAAVEKGLGHELPTDWFTEDVHP